MGHLLNRFFSWLKRLLLGDFKQLLVFLIFLFIFRPYNTGIDYVAIWNIFFTGVLLAAIFNCHHTIGIKISALILGIPTFIINWWSLFCRLSGSSLGLCLPP
jgi:hypothetical protein